MFAGSVCLETHVPFGLLMIWLRANGAGQQVVISNVVVVSQDGSGNFAPNNSAGYFVVYVTARFYEEYVNIPKNKKYLMMIGDGINQTVITGNHRVVNGWTTFNSATFSDEFLPQTGVPYAGGLLSNVDYPIMYRI
ncbi:probable pectinesterase/pectinesterase inhibitor 7 [Tanacetum coccineum]